MRSQVMGEWDLQRYEVKGVDGEWQSLEGVSGRLIYSEEGAVTVMIFQDPPRDGSQEPAKVVAYMGLYTWKGDEVLHHIEISNIVAYRGRTEKRRVSWDGERLVLEKEGHRVFWVPSKLDPHAAPESASPTTESDLSGRRENFSVPKV